MSSEKDNFIEIIFVARIHPRAKAAGLSARKVSNVAIGIVNDDIPLLQNAADYLKKCKKMFEAGEIKTIEENKARFKKKK